jgi:sigma-54 dependent transcriptional regulator, flagellar regulatory protein
VGDLPPRYRPVDWDPANDTAAETLLASAPASDVLAPALEALSCDLSQADLSIQGGQQLPQADDEEPTPMDPALADAMLAQIPDGFDLRNYLEGLEQGLIVRAMESAGGTVAQAARLLGLRRTTLVEKLRKYSLTSADGAVSET